MGSLKLSETTHSDLNKQNQGKKKKQKLILATEEDYNKVGKMCSTFVWMS